MAAQFDLERDISEITDPKALRVILYLVEEIRSLKEEVARLKKDSTTSSKPPSSDITKPAHEQRQPGSRKAGGQLKHPGSRRDLLPPDKVDRVVELDEPVCPRCGASLGPERDEEVIVQQTIELLEKPAEVVEYRRYGHWCEGCQEVHYAPLPAGVIDGQLCGPRLQALLAYLKGNLGASYTELAQFTEDVLGVKVSRGMICRVIKRVNEALQEPYQELAEALPREELLHIDESGWKDSGRAYWVWVFCTQMIGFFTINRSRGSEVLKQVLGQTFGGAIVSDFFSAYVKFANARQQFCLAHLIRDIKFLTTHPDVATKEFGERILVYFRLLFHHWHARDDTGPELLKKRLDRVKRRLFMFLCSEEVPKGLATTMKKRLIKHWDSVFRFAEQPDLYQPTNNTAEQTLRHVVRIRRQTQGTRSEWGRQWCGRIMTVLSTCSKQRRSASDFIRQAVLAHHFGSQMPSLIPQAL